MTFVVLLILHPLFLFLALQSFWLYFHNPVAGFSFLINEVSRSHTTTCHSR